MALFSFDEAVEIMKDKERRKFIKLLDGLDSWIRCLKDDGEKAHILTKIDEIREKVN